MMESESIALPLGDTPISNTDVIINDIGRGCQANYANKIKKMLSSGLMRRLLLEHPDVVAGKTQGLEIASHAGGQAGVVPGLDGLRGEVRRDDHLVAA